MQRANNFQESAMSLELSIEFFPPQTTEGMEKLRATRTRLAALKPEFFSVTYGAGGSTRERTHATVIEIAAEGRAPRRTFPASVPPEPASARC
jgi:5,10-methylenetetrahydrofolate reductase